MNQTDLPELIWLLRRSSFIVSVDSGPMHIAAAITPELLSIHTWSDPGRSDLTIRTPGYGRPNASIRSGRTEEDESWKASEERPDIFQIANFVRDRLLH